MGFVFPGENVTDMKCVLHLPQTKLSGLKNFGKSTLRILPSGGTTELTRYPRTASGLMLESGCEPWIRHVRWIFLSCTKDVGTRQA
jgi:hypothetical protein